MRPPPARQVRFTAFRLLRLVFVTSLCAPLLANDKPLLLSYEGHIYAPVYQTISGTRFGPDFLPTAADYTNPAVRAAISAHGWMIFPLIPYNYNSIAWDASAAPAPPSARHWLGTDAAARDVLARLLYGLRTSLLFGLALSLAACALGLAAGTVQGFYGGMVDLLGQRFTELWSGLPLLFILLILSSLFAPGFAVLLAALLAFSWMYLANLVRAEVLRIRQMDYIAVARITGISDARIMLRHVLPNAATAALTFLPFLLADSIALLASLDFLGLGLPAGAPSLGEMLAEARENVFAPWLGISACLTLGMVLLLLIAAGEAMRETFDPHR
ncbi:MAG: ABC transporter permease subunit [Acidocella sp.]|nr:ABC transporter permease subunit [Acidocella sp.]